tara:strand:+ start:336 stop:743 length:408 start_codon:yes stop_codon:yes gene_type:complete
MSEVKTDKLTGTSTAGSILVTGEGNSTTTNLQQGLAKAYSRVELIGTASIIGSFNVSSLDDVGTGIGRSNFTSSFGAADYSVVTSAGLSGDVLSAELGADAVQLVGSMYLTARANESTSAVDPDILTGVAHGDLA